MRLVPHNPLSVLRAMRVIWHFRTLSFITHPLSSASKECLKSISTSISETLFMPCPHHHIWAISVDISPTSTIGTCLFLPVFFFFFFLTLEPAFPTLMPGTFTECRNNQGIHSLPEQSSPSFWGGVYLRSAGKAPDGLRTSRLWRRFAWQSTRSTICGHQPVSLPPCPSAPLMHKRLFTLKTSSQGLLLEASTLRQNQIIS